MEVKFRRKIERALRRLHWQWEPYKSIKNKAKVGPTAWQCCKCLKICYSGKSESTFKNLKKKYKNVEKASIYIDHIIPVDDTNVGFIDWNTYIQRLFTPEENYQPLCKECHEIKSEKENKERRKRK